MSAVQAGASVGNVCSLANYIVAWRESIKPSLRFSWLRNFLCSLFPKAILFDFCFTTMEAESEGWYPVKLVQVPSSKSLLTVLRRYFHCGTFCLLLCSDSISEVFMYYKSWLYIQLSLGNRVATFLGKRWQLCLPFVHFVAALLCLSDVDLIVPLPVFY